MSMQLFSCQNGCFHNWMRSHSHDSLLSHPQSLRLVTAWREVTTSKKNSVSNNCSFPSFQARGVKENYVFGSFLAEMIGLGLGIFAVFLLFVALSRNSALLVVPHLVMQVRFVFGCSENSWTENKKRKTHFEISRWTDSKSNLEQKKPALLWNGFGNLLWILKIIFKKLFYSGNRYPLLHLGPHQWNNSNRNWLCSVLPTNKCSAVYGTSE